MKGNIAVEYFYRERSKAMRLGKIVIGVIAGAAAGAVLGVLYAPLKGSMTRRRIARRGTDYANDAKEKFNEYIDVITDEYDTIKEEAMDLIGKGKEKAASMTKTKRFR